MDPVGERLGALLRHAPPDSVAMVHHDDPAAPWTWGRLRASVEAIDATLDRIGLGTGARVGVVMENRPECMAVVVTLLTTGRCLVTFSPLQPAARLAADISRAQAPVLLARGAFLDGAAHDGHDGIVSAAAASGLVIRLDAEGMPGHDSIPGHDDISGHDTAADPVAPIWPASAFRPGTSIEMLTSGTTGPPKRVPIGIGQIVESLRAAAIPAKTDADGMPVLGTGVSLVAVPLVHIGGLWNAVATLYAGRRLVLLDRFRVPDWVAAVERYRPRSTGLVPTAMRAVLDADVPHESLSSLQTVLSGTAPCPPELADEFTRRYGAAVIMTYGATEFVGAIAGWTLPLWKEWWTRKRGSTGRAFPGIRMRVTDPDGRELPAGGDGRLEVSTPMAGREGWVRTSDLGRIDSDGFLFITGRADDAIIRGGFKVQPETVKAALERHPAVAEAAVAGLPDRRLGAVPVAAVQTRVGWPAPTPAELTELCRQHLTPYEVPTRIIVVDALPRTPSLKVSRVELLELFADDDVAV